MRMLAVVLLLVGCATGQSNDYIHELMPSAKTLYLDTRLSDENGMKAALLDQLTKWGGLTIVDLPEQADLILLLDKTGHGLGGCSSVLFTSDCGHRGAAVLRVRETGKEIWYEQRGGGWEMSGWSDKKVGKKLGEHLVKFFVTGKKETHNAE